jgi:predicted ATPase
VDLAATVDPAQVGHAVAGAIAPDEATTDPTPGAIVRRLRDEALLVLDNCEQVIESCAIFVEALIAQSEHVRVLATSRRPLGVSYERLWRIGGLTLEDGPGPDGEAAINLFATRARHAMGDFSLVADADLQATRSICTLLDGMPLAIELAAARVPLIGVVSMAERLAQDSAVLRQTRRGVPERHRSLEATLDWSHALLSPSECVLFRRLGVFQGAFALDDAEAVCSAPDLPPVELLDALESLVDCSLVQFLPGAGAPRFRLLSSMRQYAASKLQTSEEADVVRGRHARHFAGLVRAQVDPPAGQAATAAIETIASRQEDVLAALDWLLGASVDEAAPLAGHVWRFWCLRGQYREARDWFDACSPRAR